MPSVNDNNSNNFLSTFTKNVLRCDKSIRWVGITDHNGTIVKERVRKGVTFLLTQQENSEFAKNSIIRHKARVKFESKMGKLLYAFRRYEKMNRCIIPINEMYYLIFTMNYEENDFDHIIMERIIPLIKGEENF
ncbi:MAG: hypothetical protein R3321_08415 [Nitrososphaeraceae archaeon]|nr:hypothetical protein [Nitrososphaeraceae archaeon]